VSVFLCGIAGKSFVCICRHSLVVAVNNAAILNVTYIVGILCDLLNKPDIVLIMAVAEVVRCVVR